MEKIKLNIKRKRRNWTEEDEVVLLRLWEENLVELRKTRNAHAYLEITRALGKYTTREVHMKISNFTQKYRTESKRIHMTGESPSWKFYDRVGRILGKLKPNNPELLEESYLCEDNQSRFSEYSALPSASSSISPTNSTPPLQAVPISPPIKVSTSPPPDSTPLPIALSPSPAPESISGCSASRRAKRKIVNSFSLQKDVLKISKENQAILREHTMFSQNTAREQLVLAKRSLQLLEENTQNSKYFSSKIVDISEQQLELEKDFMKIMKKVIKKINFNS